MRDLLEPAAPSHLDPLSARRPYGMAISDGRLPGSRATYVDAAFERLTGCAVGGSRDRTVLSLLGAEIGQAGYAELAAALRDGREAAATLRLPRREGSAWWCDLTLTPVHADGRITHCVWTINDIADRLRADQAVRYQIPGMSSSPPTNKPGRPRRRRCTDSSTARLMGHSPPSSVQFTRTIGLPSRSRCEHRRTSDGIRSRSIEPSGRTAASTGSKTEAAPCTGPTTPCYGSPARPWTLPSGSEPRRPCAAAKNATASRFRPPIWAPSTATHSMTTC
jgi:PAS domain S-box-containing protein